MALDKVKIGVLDGTSTGVKSDRYTLPSKTTTQRDAFSPAAAVGDLIYNSTLGIVQQYTAVGWKSVDSPPVISGFEYSDGASATAENPAGGGVITITGSNFDSVSGGSSANVTVTVDNTACTSISVNSGKTSITATVPAKAAGSYTLAVANANGLSATSTFLYDAEPAWTATGALGTFYIGLTYTNSGTVIRTQAAEGGDTIVYTQTDSSGSTITSTIAGLTYGTSGGNEGYLTGTLAGTHNTTYNFYATAKDAENQITAPTLFNIIAANMPVPSTIQYLVIAGGGGGGHYPHAGGGGAGGYRLGGASIGTYSGANSSPESELSISAATNYTLTIGAAGALAGAGTNTGGAGGNSVLGTITSTGGGGGGSNSNGPGSAGGSGGGGGDTGTGSSGTGGAGTANQGFAGGNGYGNPWSSGGGGGAGAVGGAAGNGTGGDGGVGLASTITGSSVTRAGGGGGQARTGTAGDGGAGGGGDSFEVGAGSNNSTSGTANTGGGGGAGNTGGTGVVIIAYPSTNAAIGTIHASHVVNGGSAGAIVEDTSSRSGYRVYVFTAGDGNIQWA